MAERSIYRIEFLRGRDCVKSCAKKHLETAIRYSRERVSDTDPEKPQRALIYTLVDDRWDHFVTVDAAGVRAVPYNERQPVMQSQERIAEAIALENAVAECLTK